MKLMITMGVVFATIGHPLTYQIGGTINENHLINLRKNDILDYSLPVSDMPSLNFYNMDNNDTSRSTIATIERFNTAFNLHDVDSIMANMTEDCIFENTNPAPDGTRYEGAVAVRAYWVKFFTNNPDAVFEVEDMIANGDRCVVRWIYRKTKEGKPWHLRGVDVFKVRGGKVAEKFSYVKG